MRQPLKQNHEGLEKTYSNRKPSRSSSNKLKVHEDTRGKAEREQSNSYEVAELTWENGQPAMHGLGGLLHSSQATKATWGRTSETLESIVHQAASCHSTQQNINSNHHQEPAKIASAVASSDGKWAETSSGQQQAQMDPSIKKRARSESKQYCRSNRDHEHVDRSACASASPITTYASFESTPSYKAKTTDNEDSSSHGGSVKQTNTHTHTHYIYSP
ncbi:hypothetical protein GH714_040884 [Hevea brasiliensis]|uniref:Uncharacterized protein n=1 Tax=Hevea brasiliensis TaxID=3981 RepID=A0A6A6MHS2_HEVBR|nr:hypothetical protein GH714_040884 [Hevea brasiliensis]